jgi:hypothetical protein
MVEIGGSTCAIWGNFVAGRVSKDRVLGLLIE